MDNLKTLIIVPAFDEEKAIGSVLRNIKRHTSADIVVVNDGSTDSTLEMVKKENVKAITIPFNLGIGGAMQTGYMYAKSHGYDIAVQIDADGQHDPSYLDKLLAPVINGRCDMAIGSRFIGETSYRSTVSRRAGIAFFSWLIYLLTGIRIKDPTSGFRAVGRKVIEYFADNYPTDYPEVDVIVKLHKKNFRIIEVPVQMRERQGGTSSITPIKSIYYMIKVSLALLINSIRSEGMI